MSVRKTIQAVEGPRGEGKGLITLDSVADGAMRQSKKVSNVQDQFLDVWVTGRVGTGAAPVAGGVIKVYAAASVDNGAHFSGGADGTDSSFGGEEEQLFLLGTIVVDATPGKVYQFGPFSLREAFRGMMMPPTWSLVFKNETGDALSATAADHAVVYRGQKAESV